MKSIRKASPCVSVILAVLLLAVSTNAAQAQYSTAPDGSGGLAITAYTGSDSVVSIPGTIGGLTVTSISDNAFANSAVTSVTIPDSVTSIGSNAFDACSSLSSITIGPGVTTIGSYAFQGCSSLSSVTIPDGVTVISSFSFYQCTNLSQMILPASTSVIGDFAFSSCFSLNSIAIPGSVTSIGSYAFANAALESLSIPGGVTSIGDDAFLGCSYLPNAVFYGNAPAMGSNVFHLAESGFKAYFIDGATGFTAPNWTDTSGDTYPAQAAFASSTSNGQIALSHYTGPGGAVIVPSSVNGIPVTSLASETFEDETNVTSVTLPSNLTAIGFDSFLGTSLTTVTIPASVTTISGGAFSMCPLTNATFLGNAPTMGKGVFSGTPNNFTVDFYNSTTGFTAPSWTDDRGDIYAAFNLGDPVAAIALSGNPVFGNVVVNTTVTTTLTIINLGTAPLVVSSIGYPNGFTGNWPSGTIPAGGTQGITVTFAPTALANYTGKIAVTSNAGSGRGTIAVSGTGSSDPFSGSSLGGGWNYSFWFGYYNTTFYPWIYRADLGFIYVDSIGSDLYLYVDSGNNGSSLGWFYTNQNDWPNVYSFTRVSWLYFSGGTSFYNYATQSWETY